MASSEERITAYRIVAPRWVASAFSGEGAQKFGGRWNSPGRCVVYLADSRALAALEMLVHLTSPGSRTKPFVMIPVSFPSMAIETAREAANPRLVGDDWISSGRTLALRVPSVVGPEEFNFLINPSHPEFSQIGLGEPKAFGFDHRL